MGFFATSAVLGAFLRFLTVHPIAGFNYGHLLHTHSHLAFLGWVFNAFFAIALQWFVPPDTQRALLRRPDPLFLKNPTRHSCPSIHCIHVRNHHIPLPTPWR